MLRPTKLLVNSLVVSILFIQTDRQTDVSLRHHKEGSAERLFPDRMRGGEGRSAALIDQNNNIFNTFL